MSLLGMGLAGALGAGATTASNVMQENIKNNWQTERDQANYLRTQNLMRLKSQLDTQEYADKQDATYSPWTVDDMPAKFGEVKAAAAKAAALKQQQGLINQNVQDRQGKAIADAQAKGENGGEVNEDDLDAIQAAGKYTDDETAAMNQQGPKIVNSKEAALEAKLANQKDLSDAKLAMQDKLHQMDNDTKAQIAKIRDEAFRDRTQAILQAAQDKLNMALQLKQMAITSNNTGALKEAQLAIQKAEEERKNATAASKLLQEGDMNNPDTVRLYNKFLSGAGDIEGIKPVPEAKAQKVEQKGLLGKAWDAVTGGGSASAAAGAPKAAKLASADVDAQAQDAIMKVNADKALSYQQKQEKINAIQQRRNQLVGR